MSVTIISVNVWQRVLIENAAVIIDLQRLVDEAPLDIRRGDVLPIADVARERQAGKIALGLGRDVEIDGLLQAPARAGHFRVTER